MRLTIVLLLFTLNVQGANWKRVLYRVSQAALAAAHVADARTSMGLHEANPVLGRGPFGTRQVLVKAGIAGAGLAVGELLARRNPGAVAVGNFAAAGVIGTVAYRNSTLRRAGR